MYLNPKPSYELDLEHIIAIQIEASDSIREVICKLQLFLNISYWLV